MQEVKNTTCHFWVVDLEMVDFKPLKNEQVRIEVKGSQFMTPYLKASNFRRWLDRSAAGILKI